MKTSILISVLLFLSLNVFAQLSVAEHEKKMNPDYRAKCKKMYMEHFDYEAGTTVSRRQLLFTDKDMNLYLFWESGAVPDIKIYDPKGVHITNYKTEVFEKERYLKIRYKTEIYGVYEIRIIEPKSAGTFAAYFNRRIISFTEEAPEVSEN